MKGVGPESRKKIGPIAISNFVVSPVSRHFDHIKMSNADNN